MQRNSIVDVESQKIALIRATSRQKGRCLFIIYVLYLLNIYTKVLTDSFLSYSKNTPFLQIDERQMTMRQIQKVQIQQLRAAFTTD